MEEAWHLMLYYSDIVVPGTGEPRLGSTVTVSYLASVKHIID